MRTIKFRPRGALGRHDMARLYSLSHSGARTQSLHDKLKRPARSTRPAAVTAQDRIGHMSEGFIFLVRHPAAAVDDAASRKRMTANN
jgi:hypothetical protein